MARLTLWRPYKGADYEFADKISSENLRIGGAGVLIHKYAGPTEDGDISDIEDVLFLENRNRYYEENVIELRCSYQPEDSDYDLSQFGIFLSSDVMRIIFHYNDMVDSLGRKLISGDVLEFPNMRDAALNGVAINKYFVVQDALYSASGHGHTWYPHLWKIRAKQMPSDETYSDVLDKAATGDTAGGEGEGTGIMPYGYADMIDPNGNPGTGCNWSIRGTLDLYCKILDITDDIIAEAREDVFYDPRFYETPHIYITIDKEGHPVTNYWSVGDGVPPNGAPLKGMGISFPEDMIDGEYFLRVDYQPDRLFQKQGNCFARIEDDLRQYWKPMNRRLETYIDNINITELEDGTTIREKQPVSKIIPQKKDLYAEDRIKTITDEEKRQRVARRLDGAD